MRIACPFPTPPPPPLARFAASESLATAASHLASDMGSGVGIFGTTPASAHARRTRATSARSSSPRGQASCRLVGTRGGRGFILVVASEVDVAGKVRHGLGLRDSEIRRALAYVLVHLASQHVGPAVVARDPVGSRCREVVAADRGRRAGLGVLTARLGLAALDDDVRTSRRVGGVAGDRGRPAVRRHRAAARRQLCGEPRLP